MLRQTVGRLYSVHLPFKVDIHQHQIGRRVLRRCQGFFARGHSNWHIVAHALQPQLQIQGDDGLIFDNEDSCPDIGGFGHSHTLVSRRRPSQGA